MCKKLMSSIRDWVGCCIRMVLMVVCGVAYMNTWD